MIQHYCTVTTASHLGKTFAMIHSVKAVNARVMVHVLLLDKKISEVALPDHLQATTTLYDTSQLKNDTFFLALQQRYSINSDSFRWSLKPVFLRWLFSNSSPEPEIDRIIYIDNDIYFTGNADFLFEMLDKKNVIVTPHHHPDDPFTQPLWFETNFRDGIFNAGFFGASKKAIPALEWWAKACLYKCSKSYRQGLFVDQKYLDLMPVIEPTTGIVHHKGCNIAYWNIGKLTRNTPLIFIHFADCTINAIINGQDEPLKGIFSEYQQTLRQYGVSIDLKKIKRKETFWAYYRQVKWLLLGGIFIKMSAFYKETTGISKLSN